MSPQEPSENPDATDALPAPNIASDAMSTPLDLGMQLDRVLLALQTSAGNPVEELQILDQLHETSGSPQFVDQTARRLFQQSGVFDNLNFQSSLLAGGSSFFGAVVRRMGELVEKEPELAEGAKLPVLIRLVEHNRRGMNADEMRKYAQRVTDELKVRVEANDKLALGQQAKVAYELSMHEFNEGNFEGAIRIGEESITLCDRAGDLYGVLAARGNTAGLFRYSQKKSLDADDLEYAALLNEGRSVLEEDLHTTQEQIASLEQGTPGRRNFERVESNNAMHLMRIAALQGDLDLARRAMKVLQPNYVYILSTNVAKDGAAAVKGDVYTGILEELERKAAEQV